MGGRAHQCVSSDLLSSDERVTVQSNDDRVDPGIKPRRLN